MDTDLEKRKAAGDPIAWNGETLFLLDQRGLPGKTHYLALDEVGAVGQAITDMVVRGAPAIGITAAYGVALSVRAQVLRDAKRWREGVNADIEALSLARPTAINLAWALARMGRRLDRASGDPFAAAAAEAVDIHNEDVAANRRMGEIGAALLTHGTGVLTHCNAGALATGGYGTALGVVRSGFAQGKIDRVLADETRPWLQGARLTAWELEREGIPVDVISDAAASYAMRKGMVDWVIVGADRIARNGDVANKIGTYGLAVSARHHGLKFMVVAPTSTIDLDVADGEAIPIEVRAPEEVLNIQGHRVAALGAGAWNPVFDVTPAGLVDVIVTERGAVQSPTEAGITALFNCR